MRNPFGVENGEPAMTTTDYGIWDQIAGKWKQAAGEVKRQWGDLTDDELMMINGDRDKLAGKIQEHYGITKEEAHNQIDEWSRKLKL
jgi:uncharacterized protein YjbJ (UPF0337 family)